MATRARRARIAGAIFLTFLVGIAFFGAYSGRQFALTNEGANQGARQRADENQPEDSFWVRAKEPVALFTFFVAAFTAVLSVSTIGLWRATKRSAAIAERALTDLERPWVFRDIVTVTWRHTPRKKFNDWYMKVKWKNVGRAPALLVDIQFKIEDIDKLPAVPNYSGAQHLGVVASLAQGGEFETREAGPSVGVKPDGSPIQYVFFGRLIYREMNGKEHCSGFALQLAPFAAYAIDHNSDAYNYYT